VRALSTQGFDVLRGLADPHALGAEVDACMRDAFAGAGDRLNAGAAGNEFRYVPTMCERTPVSLALVLRLAAVASELLGAPVLPGRAKATTYRGSTKWHRDSDLGLGSVGIAFYLEPLDAETGALRVVPGSHRSERDSFDDGVAVPTSPGDAIAFDEGLYHSSSGGGLRRQWRVDFVPDRPHDDALLRTWFARQYSVDWDGGYDADRYPSYGAHWRTLDAHWNARLAALGAYAAAEAEESAVRACRANPGVSR
jgi:hypothetical protein